MMIPPDPINAMDDYLAVLQSSMKVSFRKAAQLAKQTGTFLVVSRDDEIVHIPADEIDAFLLVLERDGKI